MSLPNASATVFARDAAVHTPIVGSGPTIGAMHVMDKTKKKKKKKIVVAGEC